MSVTLNCVIVQWAHYLETVQHQTKPLRESTLKMCQLNFYTQTHNETSQQRFRGNEFASQPLPYTKIYQDYYLKIAPNFSYTNIWRIKLPIYDLFRRCLSDSEWHPVLNLTTDDIGAHILS